MRSRPGIRRCTKSGCSLPAVATLSYNYAEQIATLAHLNQYPEPHTYDLCLRHSERLTVPRGWQVIAEQLHDLPTYSDEDFTAIADAVRDVASADLIAGQEVEPSQTELRRRGHLRAL